MPATDIGRVIATLNHNISLEHGAIIQYLLHAYTIGEGSAVSPEVINIARTEMRHLKLFGDLVVDLGGRPNLHERGPMFLEAGSAEEMMRLGVKAEEEAIKAYETAVLGLDHAGAQRVIERVLEDERFHQHQFGGFVGDAGGIAAVFPPTPQGDPGALLVVGLLNEAVSQEYRGLLHNVRLFLESRDRTRDRVEEVMVWGMKHVGFLADEVHERGGLPDLLSPPDPDSERTGREAILEAIAQEEQRAGTYTRISQQVLDPDLQKLLANLHGHGAYDGLKLKEEAERLAAGALVNMARCPFHGGSTSEATVGSLLGESQP